MLRLSEKKALHFLREKKGAHKSKYGAVRTEVDGITFDSKREAARYTYLRRREQAGEIYGLQLQPTYEITINDIKICKVKLDFSYWDTKQHFETGAPQVIEDVKGKDTPVSKLKRKLVEAQHSIKVRIVK